MIPLTGWEPASGNELALAEEHNIDVAIERAIA
jgi:hypothetical protein